MDDRATFDKTIDTLLDIRWWNWSDEKIALNLDAIQAGCVERIVEVQLCVQDLFIMEKTPLLDLTLT